MRGYSEFMGYRSRVVYDAGSKSFEARRMDGPVVGVQAPEAAPAAAEQLGCGPARHILAEALCLPQCAFPAETRLASLASDNVRSASTAPQAEENSDREYDAAQISALGNLRVIGLLVYSSQSRRAP